MRVLGLATVLLASCTSSPPDEQIARRFVDAHYVRIDRPAALAVTAGLARSRIEKEVEDTAGQPISRDTRQPEFRYTLVESRTGDDGRTTFLFDAEILVPGSAAIHRELWITTSREDEGVRVVAFRESVPTG